MITLLKLLQQHGKNNFSKLFPDASLVLCQNEENTDAYTFLAFKQRGDRVYYSHAVTNIIDKFIVFEENKILSLNVKEDSAESARIFIDRVKDTQKQPAIENLKEFYNIVVSQLNIQSLINTRHLVDAVSFGEEPVYFTDTEKYILVDTTAAGVGKCIAAIIKDISSQLERSAYIRPLIVVPLIYGFPKDAYSIVLHIMAKLMTNSSIEILNLFEKDIYKEVRKHNLNTYSYSETGVLCRDN